jgi:hypothetical protein
VDKEGNVGAPCADCNRHGKSVPIPNGDSTKPQSHMSARFIKKCLYVKIDAHTKYNQSSRSREGQGAKDLPTGPQPMFFIENGWLTSSNIIHTFAKAFWVSLSIREPWDIIRT